MGRKYAKMEKKLQDIESRLLPILSVPPNPETTSSHQPASDEINKQLLFLDHLVTAEMALGQTPAQAHKHHLGDFANRVRVLQKTLRAWTEAQPSKAFLEPGSPSTLRCTEFCLHGDDDHDHVDDEGKEFSLAGFKVYKNPEYLDDDDKDDDDMDDDDLDKVEEYEGEQKKVEECEGVMHNEEEERKVIRSDNEIVERSEKANEEDGEDDHTTDKYCFKIIFGVIMIGMGIIFLFAGFADDHPSVFLLTPT